jgi:vacuolar-type H+-ATPase subunit C/Vma6
MRSRFLAWSELEALSETGDVRGFSSALAGTPYRRSLESALVRLSGQEAIAWALRDDMARTVAQIRRFYRDDAAAKVAIILRAYDVQNLKAVLRELESRAAPDELAPALAPAVELPHDVLHELAQAASPRAAIDLLASMAMPFAAPLVRLRAERPGAGLLEMELALDKWYFQQAFDALREGVEETLLDALRLDADLINLQTVLRLAAMPEEHAALQSWLGTGDTGHLFVGPGRLSIDLLTHAATRTSPADAVSLFAQTRYENALSAGMEAYRQNARLSSFERQLYRQRLATMAHLIIRQPLGIGVVLGYLALKTNEVNNLRWIAGGVALAMKPDRIRAELVYLS